MPTRSRFRRVYELAPAAAASDGEIVISPLRGREAVLALVKHAFRLDITDRVGLRDDFDRLARVAARSLLYRLAFPRDLSRLSAVREAILEHLEQM